MVDLVRPLKFENPASGGTETDLFPTETDPSEDYVASKGLALGGDATWIIDKIGRFGSSSVPNTWMSHNFNANGSLNYVEFYNSASFITANRLARVDMTYGGTQNLTTEVWSIYDTNGATVLRTITYTVTYSGGSVSSVGVAVT